MKKIGFLLILLLICNGCKKVNPSDFSPSLIGEWSWISTCGGFLYRCYTPSSTNKEIRIVYKPDSTYFMYQNDTLIMSDKFHTFFATKTLKYDSGNQVIFSINHDTLTINDGISWDGSLSVYKRLK